MSEVLIVDYAPSLRQFNDPLEQAVVHYTGGRCIRLPHTEIAKDQTIPQEYSGVVLSGTPFDYPIDTVENCVDETEWAKEHGDPIFGTCLGLQLIASVHGGKTRKSQTETGKVNIEIVSSDLIFDGLRRIFTANTQHRASTTLPDGFKLLARNNVCENQVIKHSEKDIYGVQFHPEQGDAEAIRMLSNFLDLALKPEEVSSEEKSKVSILVPDLKSSLGAVVPPALQDVFQPEPRPQTL